MIKGIENKNQANEELRKVELRVNSLDRKGKDIKNPEAQEKIEEIRTLLNSWKERISIAKEKLSNLPEGPDDKDLFKEIEKIKFSMSVEEEEAEGLLNKVMSEYKEQEEDMGERFEEILAEEFAEKAPLLVRELSKEIENYKKNFAELKEKVEKLNSYKSDTKERIGHLKRDVSPKKAAELEEEMASMVGQSSEEIGRLKHLIAIGKDIISNDNEAIVRYRNLLENKSGEINLSEEAKQQIKSQIEALQEELQNLDKN